MSVLEKAAGAVTAKALAWAIGIGLILLALLGLSAALNVRQWADHRAYVRAQAAELKAAAAQAGLKVAAVIATQKEKDDPKLMQAVDRIESRVIKLANQKRPAPLPVQCAPGQQRMDAVNAGADR